MKKLAITISAALSALASVAVAEPLPGTSLEVFVESAAVAGAGRTVTLRRVPVRNMVTGAVNWYDIAFQLTSDANGQLSFERISQIDVSPPVLSISAFRAGLWQDDRGNVWRITGPAVGPNGYENYTLQKHTGNDANLTMNWSTEPMATHFQGNTYYSGYKVLYDAKDPELAFGTLDFTQTPSGAHLFYGWDGNSVFVGAQTVGENIIVFSSWSSGVQRDSVRLNYVGPAAQ
ncbi:MAG: hypothetical protein R3E87_17155 [Burkholderiaceae bacterium]